MGGKLPFVSICTPTFNRRPFIPFIIQCFLHQDYPKKLLEWIIIDDGTDKIEDLVKDIKQVKYYKFDEKMTLGKKRNIAHEKSKGEIIVYMDDDDYYPPCRVSHAVCKLMEFPNILCAGSSEMHIYFKHIQKMYQFGPFGPNHATAATFAFRRKLLKETSYDEKASLAEEKHFLKNYTIPFLQLECSKTILVFSHIHNSFDKKELLENPNQFMKLSEKTIDDFIKEESIKHFFLNDIDHLLANYEPGNPENKPDVLKQIKEIKQDRERKMLEFQKQQQLQQQQQQQNNYIQQLMLENNALKEKVKYLENTIKKIIQEKIENAKRN